ncbi:MAG TPA: hypothetical protein VL379_09215 [Pseudomonadales bacterium]|jgi:hypothetical protein|nr:hypothetical protein [Pseudomonadales bacterium]
MIRTCLLVTLTLATSSAFACRSNSECEIGWQCLAQLGQIEGVCTSIRKSGHADDGGLSHDPTDPAKANVSSCEVDLDCGPLNKCLRSPGKVTGTCAGGSGGIHVQH